MEDFNHDNQNIDTALTALRTEVGQKTSPAEVAAAQMWVKAGETTLTKSASILSVTLKNAEQYCYFLLFYDTLGSGQVNLSWSGYSKTYTLANLGNIENIRCCGMVLAAAMPRGGVFIWHNGTSTQSGSNHSDQELMSTAVTTGTIFVSLRPLSGGHWVAGDHLEIYGLKQ